MKTSKIINMFITSSSFFLFFSVFLLLMLIRTSKSQLIPKFPFPSPPLAPRPLCLQQITLANHACGLLPYFTLPPPSPPPPAPHPPHSNTPPHHHDPRHHHHHHHHHRSHHDGDHTRPSRHRKHRHRRHHEESLIEEECCRWLKELDSECVCSLLFRLPKFMVRPLHQFTATVEDICNVTYHCPSLWLGK
ncbi:mastermind-like domain-containing protein 1 [Impatiens glandulifera]|uniref:mastermind-like domain-containing protein 1 n=1 Tax=Impatiens glandulifera TaxID=253017 RepID=UPI001FB0F0D7|nr:mastermind-like domain-containing protein 1 [Impatiens glandulifera]